MKYILKIDFAHWKKGDVMEEYEFKKLPAELKKYAIPQKQGNAVTNLIVNKKLKPLRDTDKNT